MKKTLIALVVIALLFLGFSIYWKFDYKSQEMNSSVETDTQIKTENTQNENKDSSGKKKSYVITHGLFRFNLSTEKNSDNPYFCKIDKIDVSKNQNFLQTIQVPDNEFYCDQTDDLLIFVDANFDGSDDLEISTSIAATNAFYGFILFNKTTGKYEVSNNMGSLSNPQFDKAKKIVTEYNHDSCCHGTLYKYKFVNNKLTKFEVDELYDDGNFSTTTVETVINDKIVSSTTTVTKSQSN